MAEQAGGWSALPKIFSEGRRSGELQRSMTFVIKVGTSSLIRSELQSLNLSNLSRICETVKLLHSEGHHVIIVTSGAVGVGCQRLGLLQRPECRAKKQALAAVGQVHLMKFYEDFLGALGLTCAQVLLTLDNLADSVQYLNARNTFHELLNYGAVPVVNENDTVAVTQEHRFGDNDTLSAQVAALVEADYLFLLTDVDCLYTTNPKDDPNAEPIWEVEDISRLNADTSTRGTQWGTGGMATKLTAGRIATAAGTTMIICNSCIPENIARIAKGEPKLGTIFRPLPYSLRGRKRWILSVPVRGKILLDNTAVRAVRDRRMTLFAIGLLRVEGEFHAQDNVSLCDASGMEFARGLVNMGADEARLHVGRRSGSVSRTAKRGTRTVDEVVHRENLVLLSSSNVDGDSDEDQQMPPPPAMLALPAMQQQAFTAITTLSPPASPITTITTGDPAPPPLPTTQMMPSQAPQQQQVAPKAMPAAPMSSPIDIAACRNLMDEQQGTAAAPAAAAQSRKANANGHITSRDTSSASGVQADERVLCAVSGHGSAPGSSPRSCPRMFVTGSSSPTVQRSLSMAMSLTVPKPVPVVVPAATAACDRGPIAAA